MNKIKRFLEPLKEDKIVYVKSVFSYMYWGISGVMHVLFLQLLTHGLEEKNIEQFFLYVGVYAIFLIIDQVILYLTETFTWPRVSLQVEMFVQKHYLQRYVALDNNTIESMGTGKIVSLTLGGIRMWGRLISLLIHHIPQISITIIFTFVMILMIDIKYTLVFLVLYTLGFFVANFFNKKAIKWRNKRIDEKAKYTKDFVKILMSKNEILQSEKIEKEIKNLERYQENMIYYNEKMSNPMGHTFSIPEFGVNILLLIVFYVFGKKVLDMDLSLSAFVGLSGMIILMKEAVNTSLNVFKEFTKEFTEVEALWKLFDETKDIPGYETGTDFVYKNGEIQIQNLTFAYDNAKQNIFENFSLNIPGGTTTAFVGASGSGKSTLLKLIAGYIYTETGEIIIDDQKLSDIALKSYYKNIGYLTQEPSVFDGTILDNLTYAIDRKVELSELDEIINLAKCEFIYDFADGLETQVGERGIKLSGGQKQRLAIAKILLKNPKIILLDEPTSALDSFSEEQITKAMENLFVGRTVIIVAHRLQTVKNSDKIFVFENGKVMEEGKHEELVKNGGMYKKLLELQSGI